MLEPYRINKKEKVELYKFHPELLKKYNYYKPCEEDLSEPKKISGEDKSIIDEIETQKELFVIHLTQFKKRASGEHYEYLIMREKTRQIELVEKTKQVEAIEKTKQMELQIKIMEMEAKKDKKK